MRKKNPALFIAGLLINVLLAQGCASVLRGSRQWIPVTSSPERATVSVNGVGKGTTPLGIALARNRKTQVIRIECPGYNPYEVRVERHVSVMHELGNVLLASFIGSTAAWIAFMSDETSHSDAIAWIGIPAGIVGFCLIDFASGGVYSFDPAEITVTLTKASGPPRVDIMVVEADALRNVKWIRVNRN
jgi:PEGA domain